MPVVQHKRAFSAHLAVLVLTMTPEVALPGQSFEERKAKILNHKTKATLIEIKRAQNSPKPKAKGNLVKETKPKPTDA